MTFQSDPLTVEQPSRGLTQALLEHRHAHVGITCSCHAAAAECEVIGTVWSAKPKAPTPGFFRQTLPRHVFFLGSPAIRILTSLSMLRAFFTFTDYVLIKDCCNGIFFWLPVMENLALVGLSEGGGRLIVPCH